MYMWRPFDRGNAHICVEQDHNSGRCSIPDENSHSNLSDRQLWIWIHAAAFNEGFDTLTSACQKLVCISKLSNFCFMLYFFMTDFAVYYFHKESLLSTYFH